MTRPLCLQRCSPSEYPSLVPIYSALYQLQDCAEGGHIGGEARGFYKYKDYQKPKNQNSTLFGARKKPHVVLATYNVPREQQDEHHETNNAERFKYKLVKPWGFSFRSVSLTDLQDQWVRCTEVRQR